ncbi:pyridoxal phosphate-dependent decarboxylase family protein [Kozakia baliensis]|uniref:Cytochrome D ubiquinol oxidase subunit I n=1 Tax=Kozakia baliensis TaxID=153496 RepID=A0A1D8UTS8_9PROT|nr:pyridoxal-dependent decarboxylase [Kozakia baliensis]AOX17052.1 cytochrome D ubiquinol oxidase subunit I [Kozakia baliensis]GBR25056.1 aromatic-L-amino-acid decarboxylase [Kozakia baliensis NRIC 0488]GEL63888.1 cytochrome d ubiquinol oxidase subunit I [Kozakia baliensis]
MAGLDPDDWSELRALGHRMIDDIFARAEHMGEGPVWRPMPQNERAKFAGDLPGEGQGASELYERFRQSILPYSNGNPHPGFMGWVQGAGTPIGILAELLAASLNDNCGGRDHAAIEVERQVIRWTAEMVGFPADASGCLVTGSSLANFISVITASRARVPGLRQEGVGQRKMVGYAAVTAHGCLPRAFDLAGFGSDALRLVEVDENYRIKLDHLRALVAQDKQNDFVPFIVIGTAGTVDCGAVDELDKLADFAQQEKLWFHVDGAFGALACLSPTRRPLLNGIERADSLAVDFHKWGQVPYDAGCVVVRDAQLHAQAFAQSLHYLTREDRGLAGNAPWFCDFGPDLSRGFRALKVWMTLSHYGSERMGEMVENCCSMAQYLAERVGQDDELMLLAPVALNIVCFGHSALDDFQTGELVKDLQESGIAAPSTTRINGRLAIRAAIVNHRTTRETIDRMLDAISALAEKRRVD